MHRRAADGRLRIVAAAARTSGEARTGAVRAALARAAGPAHRPADGVVRETHISHVFLVGDRAYKVKKSVVLPFLDFGTPERRRVMCHEEVRINRRLAPDLYLGVRALAPCAEGLELVAEEDPRAVEYLVEMRRFDEACTLAARLARGEVVQEQVIAVGRALARFHAGARRVTPPGVPVLAVERRMAAECGELLAAVEQRAEVGRVLDLERFAHAFIAGHAAMLDARARHGLIREGHGDLRADHVLLDGAVRVVDGIEFDPALREVDVADDLAFLVMDLEARDGHRFAATLVHAYRQAGGDPGDDALIAFYATYRALVRAKVALLRAAQHPISSAEHGHESASARELLALAERIAWRARLPLAIVICGLPASGKSHLARTLAEASGLPHLSSDVTRKALAGVAQHRPAPPEAYRAAFDRRTYAELGRRAAREVADQGGVLIDATFRHRADRDAFAGAFDHAAPLLFVECSAPPHVLARRAARRDRGRTGASDATLAIVMRESTGWEPLDEAAPDAHLVLRSDRPVAALVADLRALMDERVGGLGSPRTAA